MKREPLILLHARDIRAKLLDSREKKFRRFLGKGRGGLYVLYEGKRAVYVGLASSLRWRIPKHLRDHLAGKWDRFSLFVVRKAKYLKDLETLLIRVTKAKFNKQRGKFSRHKSVTRKLNRFLTSRRAR